MGYNTHRLWSCRLVTKSGYSCYFRKTQRKCDLPQCGLIFIIEAEILCWQIHYFLYCHYEGISHSCSFQDIRCVNKRKHTNEATYSNYITFFLHKYCICPRNRNISKWWKMMNIVFQGAWVTKHQTGITRNTSTFPIQCYFQG